ncbi:MAG: exo-alpha-sialidase [Solirubrobacterales bacterium]|nr:exo-alpha-sialidase [Solirubrobacterales bacterium]
MAYYGASDQHATRLTAYLTQSAQGAAANPVLVSAALNDPARPVFHPSGVNGGLTPRADYVGAAYDAGGTLWGGLVKQLGTPDAQGTVATTGLVARMGEPAPPAPAPPAPAASVRSSACASRRQVVFHLPAGSRGARAWVQGRPARVVRGARHTVAVDLRGTTRREIRVRLAARSRSGATIRRVSVLHLCRGG